MMSSKPCILGPWKEHINKFGRQDFAEAHAIAALPELLAAYEAALDKDGISQLMMAIKKARGEL